MIPTPTTVSSGKFHALGPMFSVHGRAGAALLNLAAGFADAVGYLQAGVFAANMTGNTVLIGIAVAQGHWAIVGLQVMAIAGFFAGAFVGRMCWVFPAHRVSVLLLLEAGMLLAAAFNTNSQMLSIGLVAGAMGAQATAVPKFAGFPLSTVVVTSTIAKFAEVSADALRQIFGAHPVIEAGRGALLAGSWLSYFFGAAIASLLTPIFSAPLCFAAAPVLAYSVLLLHRRGDIEWDHESIEQREASSRLP